MRKVYLFIALLGAIACSEKKTDLSGNTPLKINDFNKAFKTVSLPVSLADSNLKRFTDTFEIGRKALAQFVPDSVVDEIIPIKEKKSKLFPIFKIVKEEQYYLLFNVLQEKKTIFSRNCF